MTKDLWGNVLLSVRMSRRKSVSPEMMTAESNVSMYASAVSW